MLLLNFTGKLHLIGIVTVELNRKIWEGGLMATRCVNSPGLRHLVSIHLGFLCHLKAVRMHAAEPRVWKTGWASPQLSCFLGEKKSVASGCRVALREDNSFIFSDLPTSSPGLWQRHFYNLLSISFYTLTGLQIPNDRHKHVCLQLTIWSILPRLIDQQHPPTLAVIVNADIC